VPIIQDPTLISDADYLLIESTYGDKLHDDTAGKEALLLKYATETFQR
jgi:metallo-beta-lactamase family protein